jgi:hypothetical protein
MSSLSGRGKSRRLASGTLGAVAVVLLAVATLTPLGSSAMEQKIAGNQLILGGPVVGNEPGKATEAHESGSGLVGG